MLLTTGIVLLSVFAIYKILTWNSRKSVLLIANTLGVKAGLVDGMLAKMDKEKGAMLLDSISKYPTVALSHAVYTFFIYRIFLVNQNHQEINWWVERLESKGFDKHLDNEMVDIASMYLAGNVDSFELRKFVESYNEKYAPKKSYSLDEWKRLNE